MMRYNLSSSFIEPRLLDVFKLKDSHILELNLSFGDDECPVIEIRRFLTHEETEQLRAIFGNGYTGEKQ